MLQALLLLINSLFVSDPSMDQATMDAAIQAQMPGYTVTYDAATGMATVTNPDGSVIINPVENN